MFSILADPTWNSSSTTTRFSKLHQEAKKNWERFQTKNPVAAIHLRELDFLNKNTSNPHLRERADCFRECIKRMQSCQIGKPCQILGCRRCSQKTVYETSCQLAQQIHWFTTARRGRAVAITLKSAKWQGNLDTITKQLKHDMKVVSDLLQENNRIEGSRLVLDATAVTNHRQFQLDQPNPYLLHIHGTLLVRFGRADKVLEDIEEQAKERGSYIEFWHENLKGSFRTSSGKLRTEVLSFQDAAAWSCYSEKLQNGGKLWPRQFREIQREMHDEQRSWCSGKLDFTKPTEPTTDNSKLNQEREALLKICIRNKLSQPLTDQLIAASEYEDADLLIDTLLECSQTCVTEMSRHDRTSSQMFRRYLDSLKKETNKNPPTIGAVCAIFSNIVSMRYRMQRNFMLFGSDAEGVDRLLAFASVGEQQLKELNAHWPALLPSESKSKLDWPAFWSVYDDFVRGLLSKY